MSKDNKLDRLAHNIYLKEMIRKGLDTFEIAGFSLFKAAHDYSISDVKEYYDTASRILKLEKIKKKLSNDNKF